MTDAVGTVGARRHFTEEEEAGLRRDDARDDATSAIVKRDGGGADIRGTDRTWRQTKEQQHAGLGLMAGLGLAKDVYEGLEFSGALPHAAEIAIESSVLAPAIPVALAGAGLWIGTREWLEAQMHGKEQGVAIARDQAHVALIGVLDLPAGYKQQRLERDYAEVPRGNQSPAFKMTATMMADKTGAATLQLHCDRGMNAARDLSRSGMTAEAFLEANPKAAEAYAKDAAFKEGFDAYLHTKAKAPPAEVREMDKKLDERDGWYAQSQLAIKV